MTKKNKKISKKWNLFCRNCFEILKFSIPNIALKNAFFNDLSLHPIQWLFAVNTFEKEDKPARSLYLLEIRPKSKNFKLVFLDTGKTFSKFFKDVWITTEEDLIWYIARLIPMIICATWFCVENKKNRKNWNAPSTKFLPGDFTCLFYASNLACYFICPKTCVFHSIADHFTIKPSPINK